MTDDDKALVERLRKRREAEMIGGYERIEWEDEDALEAADRIEALSAENERLREALRNIVWSEDKEGDQWWRAFCIQMARAALGETK